MRLRTAFVGRLLVLLLLLTLPAVMHAQFTYTPNNGSITITGFTGPGGDVTIPDTINGLPVTSVGDEAFFYGTNLSSVTIGNNVTNIGLAAFFNCTSMTNMEIPISVTTFGDFAFYSCTSLTGILLHSRLTSIGNAAFANPELRNRIAAPA